MNKLKDAIEELKIIKDYVNARSGCDEINIKLDANGDISACDGRVMFFFKTKDKPISAFADQIIEKIRKKKKKKKKLLIIYYELKKKQKKF